MSDSLVAIFQAYLLLIGLHWHSSKKLPMHHASSLDRSLVGLQHVLCVRTRTRGTLLWTVTVYKSGKCWSEAVCVFVFRRSIDCERYAWVSADFSLLHLTCLVNYEVQRSNQFRVRCWCEETQKFASPRSTLIANQQFSLKINSWNNYSRVPQQSGGGWNLIEVRLFKSSHWNCGWATWLKNVTHYRREK